MASSVTREKLKVYEALLCSPGMSESIKVSFSMSRKDILVLSRVIETGLKVGGVDADSIISLIPQESKEQFIQVVGEILKKAGLSDFNEKLKEL